MIPGDAYRLVRHKCLFDPVIFCWIAGLFYSTNLCNFLHISNYSCFAIKPDTSVVVQTYLVLWFKRQDSGGIHHSRAPPSDFDFAIH